MAELPSTHRRGAETRVRAKEVALKLFSQNGYDATSLREIAEQLGVTKAALYYHFASKEDIIRSLLADYVEAVDAIVAWVEEMGPRPYEILDRWAELTRAQGQQLIALVMAEPLVIRDMDVEHLQTTQFDAIAAALVAPSVQARDIYRGRLALQAIHLATVSGKDLDLPETELFEVAAQAARAILSPTHPEQR